MSKIDTNKIIDIDPLTVARKSRVKEAGDAKTESVKQRNIIGNDKLNFSARATEAAKHLNRLKELPDVRKEKVNSFREQILAGDYNPSSEDIADAILKDEN